MLTKTQELTEQDGKLMLCTTTEESIEVTPEDIEKLDEKKQREILYLENEIRVLQAHLAVLQGEKVKTAELVATADVLKPKEPKKD